MLGAGIILAIASLLLSRRVDVNDFSLHHFYRNRLLRCYLGASNPKRTPQPFTGFDPDDDLPLKELASNYPGPYPILNAANTAGKVVRLYSVVLREIEFFARLDQPSFPL